MSQEAGGARRKEERGRRQEALHRTSGVKQDQFLAGRSPAAHRQHVFDNYRLCFALAMWGFRFGWVWFAVTT
jgi:hypothetical protein